MQTSQKSKWVSIRELKGQKLFARINCCFKKGNVGIDGGDNGIEVVGAHIIVDGDSDRFESIKSSLASSCDGRTLNAF